jgi:hypothetical protein
VREDGENPFETGKKSSILAPGLAVELGGGDRGTSLRAGVGYATASNLPVGGFECAACEARSTLMTANVAAVIRPIPRIVVLQPHFVAGAGVKRYDFDPKPIGDGESWTAVLRDQTRLTGQLGVGAELSLLCLRTRLELSAFLSRFEPGESPAGSEESDFQTDLFLTLAIPIGG